MSVRADRPQKSSEVRERAATKGHGAKSGALREAAILALLSEKSIQSSAERCGVSKRTLRRWLTEDDEFKAEYEAARRAVYKSGHQPDSGADREGR